jgi:hypothetical protein
MAIKLNDLLEMTSVSVQRSQEILMQNDMEYFFKGFEGEKELTPITKTIYIPTRDKDKKSKTIIPLPALTHHNSLQLSQVTINIKIKMNSSPDGLMVELSPQKDGDNMEPLTEIKLVFDCAVPSEGLARIVDRMVENI